MAQHEDRLKPHFTSIFVAVILTFIAGAGCDAILGISDHQLASESGLDSGIDASPPLDGAASYDSASDVGRGDGSAPDSAPVADAGSDAPQTCDLTLDNWSTPTLLAGVNGTDNDDGCALTDDELVLFFSSNRPPGGGANFDTWTASRANLGDAFSSPTILDVETASGMNTGADERGASVTGDGLNLFFHSSRTGAYDIYQSSRASLQVSFPSPTPMTSLNTGSINETPFVLSDGSELFYYSNSVDGGAPPMFEAAPSGGAWTSQPLSGAGFTANDNTPVVTRDGLRIYFASSRTPTLGSDDIWTATRNAKEQPFGTASSVTTLNSTSLDRPSWISSDGCRFYFWSERGGNDHIYFAERTP